MELITWPISKFIEAFKHKQNMQKELNSLAEYLAHSPGLRTNAEDYHRLKMIQALPFFENILVYLICPDRLLKSKHILARLSNCDIHVSPPCFLAVELLRVWKINPWQPR